MLYNVSANDLRSRVSYDLGWGWPNVNKYPIDTNGNIINDTNLLNQTTGSLFVINFTIYRTPFQGLQIQPSVALVNLDDYYVSISISQTLAPSDPISGNLTLLYNTTNFTFPGNSSDISISSVLTKSFPLLNRLFFVEISGSIYDNHYYLIKFDGVNDSSPLTVLSNDLTGGVNQPNVTIVPIMNSSNNLLLSPIPNDYLFIPSKIF